VGFVHHFRTLAADEIRSIITGQAERLGVTLGPHAFPDPAAVAAIIRASNGNFRLLQRVLQQIERVLELNDLTIVTPEVVAAARESLVIGAN
jgi:Holliday junction resolvasome RuvABC ATP-dependent DNA helicase subunit